jgi:hypothetical protein
MAAVGESIRAVNANETLIGTTNLPSVRQKIKENNGEYNI